MSLMMLSMIFVMATMSFASAERIAEVINEDPSIKNPEKPDYDIPDGSIEFKDVCFKKYTDIVELDSKKWKDGGNNADE